MPNPFKAWFKPSQNAIVRKSTTGQKDRALQAVFSVKGGIPAWNQRKRSSVYYSALLDIRKADRRSK
jgi:hypothetical protein